MIKRIKPTQVKYKKKLQRCKLVFDFNKHQNKLTAFSFNGTRGRQCENGCTWDHEEFFYFFNPS